MAEMKTSCPHCGQHIECDESHLGLQIKCPSCQQSFALPAAQEALRVAKEDEPTFSVMKDGAQHGPFTLQVVNSYLRSGWLKPDDMACQDGMQDWQPIHELLPSISPESAATLQTISIRSSAALKTAAVATGAAAAFWVAIGLLQFFGMNDRITGCKNFVAAGFMVYATILFRTATPNTLKLIISLNLIAALSAFCFAISRTPLFWFACSLHMLGAIATWFSRGQFSAEEQEDLLGTEHPFQQAKKLLVQLLLVFAGTFIVITIISYFVGVLDEEKKCIKDFFEMFTG